MRPPSRRSRLVLVLGPALGGLALALALAGLGASDDVTLRAGVSPLLIGIALPIWVAVGTRHDTKSFAAERGWSFVGSHHLARPPRGAPFFGVAPGFTTNFATGDREGRTYQVFERDEKRGGGRAGAITPFTCVMTVLDNQVPFINIAKRAWFAPSTNPGVGDEIEIGDPGFDRSMRVRTEDRGFARALLTPRARELLLANRDLVVRLDGDLAVARVSRPCGPDPPSTARAGPSCPACPARSAAGRRRR